VLLYGHHSPLRAEQDPDAHPPPPAPSYRHQHQPPPPKGPTAAAETHDLGNRERSR
jgi:hypothetical protein